MGLVLACRDAALHGEEVALKVLFRELAEDSVFEARFRREVMLSRRLGHPAIARVFDYGESEDGYRFFTMELLSGGSLGAELKKAACVPARAVEVLRHVAAALAYAHGEGVLHRDLNPGNILFNGKGEPRVTDFGMARGFASNENLTKTGDTIGTPLYMAPEVIQGHKGDARSDLYSLGISAFEMVMGKPPFVSPNWVVLAGLHVSAPVPPLNAPGVPAWYQDFVHRLLEKDPARRFQSATELSSFIDRFGGGEGQGDSSGSLVRIAVAGAAGIGIGVLARSLLG
jgi:serine/threonine-protein kinase